MSMTGEKQARQSALLEIVRTRSTANQRQIADWLGKAGFEATQASISRDVRELGLVKLAGRYLAPDAAGTQAQRAGIPPQAELIHSASPAGANLVVVRTAIGSANSVAVMLDGMAPPEIVGTIAGDDTIFVAVRSRSGQGSVLAMLNGWLKRKLET